jgi:hypothetical protein
MFCGEILIVAFFRKSFAVEVLDRKINFILQASEKPWCLTDACNNDLKILFSAATVFLHCCRLPLLLGVMFGVVTAVIIITMMLCCFCSCCILYKKRQPPANGGEYQNIENLTVFRFR